ncbi:beta-lactamase/transpeptidase-like protein [Aspergillus alliaceus]|uniref:Beta-lactamase/transpeptidase-like protein n=1 Tax=Petromyces alliaceus TaxID=209559 RepID=A0A5N7BYQ3_PETAA|nr:beta-lactamase/transpeptidase-like protein [Aspergillus alliaceus]
MVQRQDSTPFTPQFDSLVQEQLEKWKVPGVTISVVHGSSTYAKAYGFAVLPDKEMTLDSLFTTCSTTKAFTAAAVSMAIDDSIKSPSPLTWDTPIASLIRDDFVLADDHATVNTTLEDALSHRSGLPGHIYAMVGAYPDESLRDAVRKLRHLPLAYPPRTTFDYCNHMFMVVSHVLEKIAGEPLGEILKKRIWDPLNMKDTYFSVQDVKRCPSTSPRLVQGYTWVPEKGSYVAEPHMNYAPTTGTGAIVSNVLDYAKWLRALIYQAGPISREGHAAVVQPRSVISNDEQDTVYPPAPYHLYALGWFVDTYQGQHLYWHSGGWPGFGIMVGFIPELHFGFAIMGNTQRARNAQLELYLYLIDTLLGVSGNERAQFVAKMTKRMNGIAEMNSESINDSKKRLFHSIPAMPIPHSLPLDGYTGAYRHSGYGVITLRVENGHLYSDLSDRVEAMTIQLEHAVGEFFVAKISTHSLSQCFKAEFYVDSTATARKVGMELEPALGDKMIWFERCL